MRQSSGFKETQLFDWHTEPQLERSSSFFHSDEVSAAEARRARRHALQKKRRRSATLVGCGCAIAVGALALTQMAPLLRHLLS